MTAERDTLDYVLKRALAMGILDTVGDYLAHAWRVGARMDLKVSRSDTDDQGCRQTVTLTITIDGY